MPSRLEDPTQKTRWRDDHWADLQGGRASIEISDSSIYLAISVRNAGSGIAVLESRHVNPEFEIASTAPPAEHLFRPHTRDLCIPDGDVGFWEAAIREPTDDLYPKLSAAIPRPQTISVEVLYGGHEREHRVHQPVHPHADAGQPLALLARATLGY